MNHLIHMEKRIIRLLKSLEDRGEISGKEKNDLYPSGSKPGVLYGLIKIHKALEDGIPSFRPILSAIGTPKYKLAKFCDQLLKPLTSFLTFSRYMKWNIGLKWTNIDLFTSLWIWSNLLKKFSMENFIFCIVFLKSNELVFVERIWKKLLKYLDASLANLKNYIDLYKILLGTQGTQERSH